MSDSSHSHRRKVDHSGHSHGHSHVYDEHPKPDSGNWAALWLGAGAGFRLVAMLPAIMALWLAIFWALQ